MIFRLRPVVLYDCIPHGAFDKDNVQSDLILVISVLTGLTGLQDNRWISKQRFNLEARSTKGRRDILLSTHILGCQLADSAHRKLIMKLPHIPLRGSCVSEMSWEYSGQHSRLIPRPDEDVQQSP